MPVATALWVTHWRREMLMSSPGRELKMLCTQFSLSGDLALRTRVNQNAQGHRFGVLVGNMKWPLQSFRSRHPLPA
jgi:hypothetical protein